jgi:hypothetical protein
MGVFQLPEHTGIVLDYWIVNFPYYGTFVFYGTDKEAQEMFSKKKSWEQGDGTMHRADPDNKRDKELVVKEITAVREDRAAGIKNLPFLPGRGWTTS